MFLFSFCSCFSIYVYLLATTDYGRVGEERNGADREMIQKKLLGWILIFFPDYDFFVTFTKGNVLEFSF